MELTFGELKANAAQIVNDDTSATAAILKRDINRGAFILSSEIKRYYTRQEKTANLDLIINLLK